MLKIYDTNHNAIGHIVKYKDLKIEGDVTTGDRTLSFTYMARHHEICEELVKRGHEVTVVTGRPNYPDGDLIDGYPNHQVLNDVEIIRTPITLRGHNPISLIRNYFSYPRCAKRALKDLNKQFDVVFVCEKFTILVFIF